SGWALCLLIVWLDVSSKALVSLLHNFLPYAREEQEAKVGFSFKSLSIRGICCEFTPAFLLLIGLLLLKPSLWWALLGALGIGEITFFAALRYLKHRIGGYTGDCYGGIFLLVELISYLSLVALLPHTL
ncbi:MAG: adenosylcobinamide-GDP ribazoletransferase, partial [Porphyromonas endodontalis]